MEPSISGSQEGGREAVGRVGSQWVDQWMGRPSLSLLRSGMGNDITSLSEWTIDQGPAA